MRGAGEDVVADESWAGKCDAFVKMCLGEQRRESRICKVNYDPTWDETFEFEVCGESEDLVLTVWDWDRIGKDEFVGSLHLPVGELKSYLQQDKSFPLQRAHRPCIGHNGSVTTLIFTCDMFPIQESFPLLSSSEATGSLNLLDSTTSRRSGTLKVTLESAERLPKNDALMRSTDPYVILSVDGQTFQSRTRRKTLEPTWNETFEFSCTAGESILSLAVTSTNSSPPPSLLSGLRRGKIRQGQKTRHLRSSPALLRAVQPAETRVSPQRCGQQRQSLPPSRVQGAAARDRGRPQQRRDHEQEKGSTEHPPSQR